MSKTNILKQRKLGISSPASRLQTPEPNDNNNDSLNDDEYLKRLAESLLCANNDKKSISLPPLTTSNNLDIHLYAFFSLLVDNFILKWYDERQGLNLLSKDEFLNELIFLFAHITRDLNERCRNNKDELIKLFLIDIPYLLESHISSFEKTKLNLSTDKYDDNKDYDIAFINEWILKYSNHINDDEFLSNYRKLLTKSLIELIFPNEIVESSISKTFLISLFNDLLIKNLISSFCDNFVIWELIGKICKKSTNSSTDNQQEKMGDFNNNSKNISENNYNDYSSIHRIFNFFIIEPKYQMKIANRLKYSDFLPMFELIFMLTSFNLRFSIIITFFQIMLKFLLNFNIINKFTNNLIKKYFMNHIFKTGNLIILTDTLRHLMFPFDTYFEMKPRFIPSNEDELNEMFEANLLLLKNFLNKNRFLFNIENDNQVDENAVYVLNLFKYTPINKIFLQQFLDLVLSTIFPELSEAV